MARNGSGTWSAPAGQPVVAGTAIDPTAHNDLVNDVGTELTDSLSRSGKGGMLAALDMGTNKITGLGTPTASTDAATKAYADSPTVATTTATLGTGWSVPAGGLNSIRKAGGVVDVYLYLTGGAAWDSIATLPVGSRPAIKVRCSAQWDDASSGKSYVAWITIDTDGTVALLAQVPGALIEVMGNVGIGAGDKVYIHATFIP